MNWQVILSERANSELFDSVAWYVENSEEVSEKFIQIVFQSFELIRRSPESFSIHKKVFRQYVIQEFPFIIVFSLQKPKNEIQKNLTDAMKMNGVSQPRIRKES